MEPLRCKMCNGPLVVDESGEFAVCEYCGTKHTRETIRKMMKVEVTGPIRVFNETIEEKLKKVKTFNKLNQRELALQLCNEIIKMCPDDYRGWWYQYIVKTNMLEETGLDNDDYEEIREILSELSPEIYNKALPFLSTVEKYLIAQEKPYPHEPNTVKARNWGIALVFIGMVFAFAGISDTYLRIALSGGFVLLAIHLIQKYRFKRKVQKRADDIAIIENRLEMLRSEYDLFSLSKKKNNTGKKDAD